MNTRPTDLKMLLKDPSLLETRAYVAGEWITADDGATFDVVNPARGEAFYAEVRKYWPGLRDGALAPGYAGIRPKIFGPQGAISDFVIQGPAVHGVAGLVNLFGIESPGLTSALAIGEQVLGLLGDGWNPTE